MGGSLFSCPGREKEKVVRRRLMKLQQVATGLQVNHETWKPVRNNFSKRWDLYTGTGTGGAADPGRTKTTRPTHRGHLVDWRGHGQGGRSTETGSEEEVVEDRGAAMMKSNTWGGRYDEEQKTVVYSWRQFCFLFLPQASSSSQTGAAEHDVWRRSDDRLWNSTGKFPLIKSEWKIWARL